MNNNDKNQVMFKRGLHANLPTSGVIEGAFYLTTDSDRLYVGKADGTLADLNKYVKMIESLANGATLPSGEEGDFLYIKNDNILAVYTNGAWKQVNPDTDTNTTYDLKAVGSDNKASVQLGAKELGASDFTFAEKFNIVGSGIASVSVDGTTIKVNVDATDLSNYYTKDQIGEIIAGYYTKAETDDLLDDKADKSYVGVLPGDTTATTIVGYVDAKTANIASDERVNGIDNRVKTIEDTTIPGLEQEIADVLEIAEAATTVDEVNGQIDTKIAALKLSETYEPIGAENRAKGYVDQKFTDANLDQYTTEQEVKDIVDKVIVDAVADDTLTGLTNLVEYLAEHGGEYGELLGTVNDHEDRIDAIEAKPAYNITDSQISNWDNEVGAKALAETKRTEAQVNDQIDAKIADYYKKTEVDKLIEDLPDVTVVEGTGIDVAVSGDAYTVSLEAITKNDTTGIAKVQEAKGTVNFDAVTGVTYDAYGRVTGIEKTSITVTDTDTHNALSSVEVAVEAAENKNSAEITHTVTMVDGESDEAAFALTSGYSVNNGGIEITANGTNVNIDLVWGSF